MTGWSACLRRTLMISLWPITRRLRRTSGSCLQSSPLVRWRSATSVTVAEGSRRTQTSPSTSMRRTTQGVWSTLQSHQGARAQTLWLRKSWHSSGLWQEAWLGWPGMQGPTWLTGWTVFRGVAMSRRRCRTSRRQTRLWTSLWMASISKWRFGQDGWTGTILQSWPSVMQASPMKKASNPSRVDFIISRVHRVLAERLTSSIFWDLLRALWRGCAELHSRPRLMLSKVQLSMATTFGAPFARLWARSLPCENGTQHAKLQWSMSGTVTVCRWWNISMWKFPGSVKTSVLGLNSQLWGRAFGSMVRRRQSTTIPMAMSCCGFRRPIRSQTASPRAWTLTTWDGSCWKAKFRFSEIFQREDACSRRFVHRNRPVGILVVS